MEDQLLKATSNEISPLTNTKSVIVDNDPATGLVSKLCIKSGFTTNSFLLENSRTVQDLVKQLPKVASDLMIVDKLGWVWLPMMQNTDRAVIYPVGTKEEWQWQVAPLSLGEEKIKEEDFNPNDPRNYQTIQVDYDNAKSFNEEDFPDAFEYFINFGEE